MKMTTVGIDLAKMSFRSTALMHKVKRCSKNSYRARGIGQTVLRRPMPLGVY